MCMKLICLMWVLMLNLTACKACRRKHIYTNGTVRHATRILDAFGIRHHFDFMFDIAASDHIPKPDPQFYDLFVWQSGIVLKSVAIEDMARNLEPAANLGMQTIWLVSDHDWAAKGLKIPLCTLSQLM